MLIVRDLFRFSGAFFMRRRFESDGLYRAIFTEYVKNLICDGLTVEFFTEGTRSRAGKLLQPRMGMLSIVTEPFFERRIKDLILCPINISYEKVIEGTTYGLELLGRPKQKESLESLLRASLQKLLWSNFGRLSVSFAQPISLRQYTESLTVEESSRSNRAVEFEPTRTWRIGDFLCRVWPTVSHLNSTNKPQSCPRIWWLPFFSLFGVGSLISS